MSTGHFAVTRGMVQAAARHPAMAQFVEALQRLEQSGAIPNAGRRLEAVAERVLYTLFHEYETHMASVLGRIDAPLARLLDDLDTMRSGGSLGGRALNVQADLVALASAMDAVETFDQWVRAVMANTSDPKIRENLRLGIAAALGDQPMFAPAGAAGLTLTPPRLGGASTDLQAAVDDLWRALRDPAPAGAPAGTARMGPEYTGRQLAGRAGAGVADAAQRLVAAAGGDISAAVRRVLAAGAEGNRMALAILLHVPDPSLGGQPRLSAGTRAPTAGTAGDPFQFQIEQTGVGAALDGRLREPVRGMSTIELDGLVGGYVIDAKFTNVPTSESGHLSGRVSAPDDPRMRGGGGSGRRDPDAAADLVDEMATLQDPAAAADVLARLEERTGIRVASELERQMQFARENGLRGVRWVCSTQELADAFANLFSWAGTGSGGGVTVIFEVGH